MERVFGQIRFIVNEPELFSKFIFFFLFDRIVSAVIHTIIELIDIRISSGFRGGGWTLPPLRDSTPSQPKESPFYYFEISIFG